MHEIEVIFMKPYVGKTLQRLPAFTLHPFPTLYDAGDKN
jgi:hypothetical protein